MRRVSFRQMKDGTEAEYLFLHRLERDYIARLPQRILLSRQRLAQLDVFAIALGAFVLHGAQLVFHAALAVALVGDRLLEARRLGVDLVQGALRGMHRIRLRVV